MKIKSNLAISESGFVFNATTGDSFSTNPIGLEIIRYLKEGHDENEIRNLMTNRYLVDADALNKDLQDFISTLHYFKLTE